MDIRQVLENYVGKKVVLKSPVKSLVGPNKGITIQRLQDDHFVAEGEHGILYYVAFDGISVMSTTGTGVLQIQLK